MTPTYPYILMRNDAQQLTAARAERGRIEAEIAGLEDNADSLSEKTATWGVARVDRAMAPILRRIGELRAELAGRAAGHHSGKNRTKHGNFCT
ncbi:MULTISPECIES: hypothetical protein [unclassified Frankia]|uniref:hypothetical protein n=1 Tax=unclassified Frankia TaxID=2632575 RepID=UPI002AD3C94D|nr:MULTISPECIES: hypothetical protein [unclassified Frankia]